MKKVGPKPLDHKPFDRKKFDPSKYNSEDSKILYRLRNRGWTRRCLWASYRHGEYEAEWPNKLLNIRSTAYEYINLDGEIKKGGTIIDAGCGSSPDLDIAVTEGYKRGIGIDLFRVPGYSNRSSKIDIMYDDICEKPKIKPSSADVVICQAVLPLMNYKDRIRFYRNAHKWLKKGGKLSVYFCSLQWEHEWYIPTERENACLVGFDVVRNFTGGYLLIKR